MKPSIEDITGFMGIGTLEILGIFFILDGISGFLSFVEIYSKTAAWGIFVTIPILVIAYIFGLLTSIGMEIFLNKIFPNQLASKLLLITIKKDNKLISTKFIELERQSRLLNGCSFAFLLLGIGSLAEVKMMGEFGFVGYLGLIGSLIVSLSCPVIARQLQKQFYQSISSPSI